jgi:endonuclease/exonuclease/phosphatase family metal-dependent hydrolase
MMSRGLNIGVRTIGAAAVASCLFLMPASAAAQTTVVIDEPNTQVADTRIQGGSNANTVFDKAPLATKVHPSNATYHRRSVLKFDTHNTVPRGATVQSAKITFTISRADRGTRTVSLFRLSRTFDPKYTTWNRRKHAYRWNKRGGDLAEKWAQAAVGSTVGTKVTFDVTSLVQAVVKGKYGDSRYTRIALVDRGHGSDTSYKEFFSTEASSASTRPKLTVVYGSAKASAAPKPKPTPAPKPEEPEEKPEPREDAPTGSTFKVLQWNIHRAWGTDGKYDLNRIANWIVKLNPSIVSLNEVERFSNFANEDQPVHLEKLVEAKTGRNWYRYYRTGNGAAKGHGNLILSRYPIASTADCQLSATRVLAQASIHVNGRLVNFYSTHWDSARSSSRRISEAKNARSCLNNDAEQKIIAGDFNAQASSSEIAIMKENFSDAWLKADASNDAYSYSGNSRYGATRKSRIDYVFMSKRASKVVLKKAQVVDTRDSRGKMPSDHKPLVVTFEVG